MSCNSCFSTEMPSRSCCLSASNTVATLRKTLQFIQQHPLSKSGYENNVTIFLKIDLLTDQVAGSDSVRGLATFSISGVVTKVGESTVQILTSGACPGKGEYYTVNIEDIIYLISGAVTDYFQSYVASLEELPSLCCDPQNDSFALLKAFSHTVKTNSENISIIYNGLNSLKYPSTSYDIVGNLVIIEKFFVLPITSIDGFFITPTCTVKGVDTECATLL